MTHKTEPPVNVKSVTPKPVQAATIHRLWIAFALVLAGAVIAQFWVESKGHFRLEGEFWFYPAFGLIASISLVLLSNFIGSFLKRPENYWEQEETHHE